MPQTVAFYEGTLGAKKVQEMEFRGIPIVRLEMDGLPLTISQQIHAGVGDHIGLAVDDFEAAIAGLRDKGVEFIVEPTDINNLSLLSLLSLLYRPHLLWRYFSPFSRLKASSQL